MRYRQTTTPIDQTKLRKAFSLMRAAGLLARMNYACCGTCASYALGKKAAETRRANAAAHPSGSSILPFGFAYYHQQDTVGLGEGEDLCIGFGVGDFGAGASDREFVKVGRIIERCCKEAGLVTDWNGSPSKRVMILAPATIARREAAKPLTEEDAFRVGFGGVR